MNRTPLSRRTRCRRVGILATIALLATSPSGAATAPDTAPAVPPEPRTAERLAGLERSIVSADYRADLEALGRLRDEAAALADDPELGYLARYWSGFASWRIAINGVNRGLAREAIRDHLAAAARELEASIAERPDFADALAASGGVHGWLGSFVRDEADQALKATVLYFMRTREALRLEPDNPRALWVDASLDLFLPSAVGGDPQRAIRTYRRMLEVATPGSEGDPRPDWGVPEAHMSLAFAHLRLDPPDPDTARVEARAALELAPDWSYVRDVLMAQIEAAAARVESPGSR